MNNERVQYFTSCFYPIIVGKVETAMKSFEQSDIFNNALAEVKESDEFKEEVKRVVDEMAENKAKSNLKVDYKYAITDRLMNEISARLSTMQNNTYENITEAVLSNIDVEEYIYPNND